MGPDSAPSEWNARGENAVPRHTDLFAQAQHHLQGLYDVILALLRRHPEGLKNVDVAEELGLHSTYGHGNQDYLSWALLGNLLSQGRIVRRGRRYQVPEDEG